MKNQNALTIGIFSPSWSLNEERFLPNISLLKKAGFKIKPHPQNQLKHGQFAGTPAARASALSDLLSDPEVDIILAARGGYGCLQILEHIDFFQIKQENHKPIIGFSDVTALLNAIYQKTESIAYHGPVLGTLHQHPNNIKFLPTAPIHELTLSGTPLNTGTASGIVLGGNMTLFDQLIGTEYFPSRAQSAILLMEDISIKINDIDKYLIHLKHSGFLPKVSAVIVGEMTNLTDNAPNPFGMELPALLHHHFGKKIPIITNTPCGHGDEQITLPIGAPAVIEVQQSSCTINFHHR